MLERRRSSRKRAIAAALVILSGIAYFGLWSIGGRQLRNGVIAWADDQRDAGLAVAYAEVRNSGFPVRLRANVSEIDIADAGRWRWTAPRLSIDYSWLAPSQLRFSATAPHELRIEGVGVFRIAAPDGAAFISGDERSWRLAIAAQDGMVQASRHQSALSAADLTLEVSQSVATGDRTLVAFDASDVDLSIGEEGAKATVLLGEIWVIGADSVASGGAGAIDFRNLHLEAEGARMELSGVVQISRDGALAGRLETDVANPGALALAAGRLGLAPAEDAQAIAGALTLAALAGGGRIVGPLTFDANGVSFAAIRLSETQPKLAFVQP